MRTGTRSSWFDLVPTCLNWLQPVRWMRLQSAKCLVENSIIDGLKSRLMQYLKHVVEEDVLFTKVISKFKPVTVHWPPPGIWLNFGARKCFCTCLSFCPEGLGGWGWLPSMHHMSHDQYPGGWLPSMHHKSHDQGVCIQGVGYLHPWGRRSACRRVGQTPPPAGIRKADGTHPTGMLPCCLFFCIKT